MSILQKKKLCTKPKGHAGANKKILPRANIEGDAVESCLYNKKKIR